MALDVGAAAVASSAVVAAVAAAVAINTHPNAPTLTKRQDPIMMMMEKTRRGGNASFLAGNCLTMSLLSENERMIERYALPRQTETDS